MTEPTFDEQVELSSLDNIKAEGISIRVGGQIVKFVADETQDISVEEEVRNELREQYNAEVDNLRESTNSLTEALKAEFLHRNKRLETKEEELAKRLREVATLPTVSEDFAHKGLSVSKCEGRGYLWSYICVYAPKYVSNKIIDPTFAKRLMTPIRIFVYTDDNWKATDVKLVKLINCSKFQHYHSLDQYSDCWGRMKYSGELLDTPDKALMFFRNTQIVLETINRMSIGERAPKGLSRLATVEKHLLDERPDPENNKRTTTSKRNERAGFDETVNDGVTAELWTT